jgi:hypothetical protein
LRVGAEHPHPVTEAFVGNEKRLGLEPCPCFAQGCFDLRTSVVDSVAEKILVGRDGRARREKLYELQLLAVVRPGGEERNQEQAQLVGRQGDQVNQDRGLRRRAS